MHFWAQYRFLWVAWKPPIYIHYLNTPLNLLSAVFIHVPQQMQLHLGSLSAFWIPHPQTIPILDLILHDQAINWQLLWEVLPLSISLGSCFHLCQKEHRKIKATVLVATLLHGTRKSPRPFLVLPKCKELGNLKASTGQLQSAAQVRGSSSPSHCK